MASSGFVQVRRRVPVRRAAVRVDAGPGCRRRGDGHALVTSCARSPRGRRRSPASRRSPTGCRRSGARRPTTPPTTLAIMGVIAITMFLSASRGSRPTSTTSRSSEERSVLGQIAHTVFGEGGVGFYIVQAFTAAILILAANTAFQDFPRLSSILARDRYMPRQFMNRGDRLVFSNGVIGLGLAACIVIYRVRREPHQADPDVRGRACSRRSRCRRPAWCGTGARRRARARTRRAGWRRSMVINVDRGGHDRRRARGGDRSRSSSGVPGSRSW